ncbi:MAG TPA: antibiotic biosynthesis monooxygenase [Candidatus Cybelea sp.]|nr:antibiotic biosynthesis monooxygenase [Candidatus Cybelea sp.]
MPAKTVVTIAIARVGQEAAVRAAAQPFVAESLAEPGCMRFEVYQSSENARIFVIVESWASQEDWRMHHEGPVRGIFHQKIDDAIVESKQHHLDPIQAPSASAEASSKLIH